MENKVKEACIIMARSFTNEFVYETKLDKKEHSLLYEFNDKLGKLVASLCKTQADVHAKAKQSAEFVLDRMQKYADIINPERTIWTVKDSKPVKKTTNHDIEGNNLALGVSFVFLLLEHNILKGSQAMYFKRVANELFTICEKESSTTAIMNVNRLISMFDDEISK